MKTMTFKNRLNGEQVACQDVRDKKVIDGVEYLLVHRLGQERMFLMRRDALEPVNTKTPKNYN